jgi:hypothetical protein
MTYLKVHGYVGIHSQGSSPRHDCPIDLSTKIDIVSEVTIICVQSGVRWLERKEYPSNNQVIVYLLL